MPPGAGCAVRVVIPEKPRPPLPIAAFRASLAELLEAGVTVVSHPGMAHAKIYRFDDRLLIGSCNLDDLSLYRNDELDLRVRGGRRAGPRRAGVRGADRRLDAGRPLGRLAGTDRRAAAREVVAMAVSGSAATADGAAATASCGHAPGPDVGAIAPGARNGDAEARPPEGCR